MKLGKLFGIKKTKHSQYYRCYLLWIPYMKIKYSNNTTKIYLFGIQVAHVPTICSATPSCAQPSEDHQKQTEIINQCALELIAKHKDSDYNKEAK